MKLIRKLERSIRHTWSGLKSAIQSEHHLRFHFAAAIIVFAAGVYVQLPRESWLWILLAAGMVILTEYLNTAIEKVTDLFHPEHHRKAGEIKDIGAGAVLLAVIYAILTGITIFIPYLELLVL